MMTNTNGRGFTLIELLVVIAIIGILASVVLASLNSARDKGADAAIKSNLNNARAQAELVYDSAIPRSYATVCTSGITALLNGAVSAGGFTGVVTTATLQTASTVNCHSAAGTWVASAPLKSLSTQSYYCVDNSGKATTGTTPLAAAATTCP